MESDPDRNESDPPEEKKHGSIFFSIWLCAFLYLLCLRAYVFANIAYFNKNLATTKVPSKVLDMDPVNINGPGRIRIRKSPC